MTESGRLVRHLLEASPEPVFVAAPDGRLVEANHACLELLDLDREAVGEVRWSELLASEEDRKRLDAVLEERGRVEAWVVEMRTAAGRRLTARIDASAHPDEDLSGGLLAFVRELDDALEPGGELPEQEASYRSLFESVTEAIYIQDRSGRFLDVNRAATEMYGYTREELIGADPGMLACPERVKLDATLERVRKALDGEPQLFEWWGRRKSGECFPKEVSLTRGHYFGREVVIAVARDVSESRELADQLRQAQKMEAVGRLAGGVAHDFNNVLTAIQVHCELALEGLEASDPVREDLEEIRSNASRAARLTRQLLAFGRKQMLRPEILDLAAVVGGVRKMLDRLVGEHIRVKVRCEERLWPVEADRSQMEQVVVNLVLNAGDAMPSGGSVELATANHLLGEAEAAARPYPIDPGPWVRLTVTDRGTGMDAEVRSRIFEPFFSTKEPGRGTGLGLSTVYGIVKQSGGFIDVESAPGEGTTFEVLLPKAGATETP